MKLSTGIERPAQPRPLVVSQDKPLQPSNELQAPVQETQLEPETEESEPVTNTLDPISQEAVANLPDAVPQHAVVIDPEPVHGPTPEPTGPATPRTFKSPFYMVLGAGAVALLTALVFRGGGASNGRTNLNPGSGAGISSSYVPEYGKPLNIR